MGNLPDVASARTFLFVPATRPDRVIKALETEADVVVVDLEDAVPYDAKEAARAEVDSLLAAGRRFAVRVNAPGTAQHAADVEVVRRHGCQVMLPKAEDPDQLDGLAGCGPVIALVETAAGVADAPRLASHPSVARLALGHLDLAAELGVDPEAREALLWARSSLVLASAAARLAAPVDGVTTDVSDPAKLLDDVRYAGGLGMGGKLCIHPRQVGTAAGAFTPDDSTLEWARAVLAAAGEAASRQEAVVTLDGRMVDRPVVERARRLLDRPASRRT